MLLRIDRLQLAVRDREEAARGWKRLLRAEFDGEDRVAGLAARRSSLRLGDGWIELLEPDGAGLVAEAVARRGNHLFAGGVSSPDVEGVRARLASHGVEARAERGQLHLDAAATRDHGLRLVVSPDLPHPPVGAIDHLYEVTHLVHDVKGSVERLTRLFQLDAAAFVPIESEPYGYTGTLTLFDPERLDRIEVITPRVAENTMGRFFARFGESLYMAFAESGELPAIEERARESGAGFTAEPPEGRRDARGADTLFLHPSSLGGTMLGLSRRQYAWRWSGKPERAGTAP